MNNKFKLMTSESTTYSHPDKFCDFVSNYLQDKFMEGDKESKVAIECAIFGRNIFVGGEVTSNTEVDVIESVKEVLEKTGYGYIKDTFNIENHIIKQSAEIYGGVVKEDGDIGAGDQGLVWGYASDTGKTNYMPIGAYLSHQLSKRLTDVREQGILGYLRPDGKTQVTVMYDENEVFSGIDTVVVSSMHTEDVSLDKLRQDIEKEVIDYVLGREGIDSFNVKKLVNTAGTFILGFGDADAGLTGRKIIVDSYGGYAKHGGGNYNGKDFTKVDRSGAYFARYLAKNVLHDIRTNHPELDVKDVEVQLGFAIGVVQPVSLLVNVYSHDKNKKLDIGDKYELFIKENIDCSPKGIIDTLKLKDVKVEGLSAYGHFGREGYSWEDLNIDFKLK